jgi:hypothetical protein
MTLPTIDKRSDSKMPQIPLTNMAEVARLFTWQSCQWFPAQTYAPLVQLLTPRYRVVSLPPRARCDRPLGGKHPFVAPAGG